MKGSADMNVIVIGGVAAGTKVAAKLKREDRSIQVTILTMGKDISYAGCGLPYYVGNVIEDKEQLIVNTPVKFAKLTGAEVVTETEVIAIHRDEKTVDAKDLKTGEIKKYSYDKLVIASGASAFVPPVEGIHLKNVFFMRTPDDAITLRESVEEGNIKRAVVVGGGFIGLEIAENLAAQNIKVSIIDMADHILPGFDDEMAAYAEDQMAEHGIMCLTKTGLQGILGTDKVEKVQTQKRAIKADAVVLSIGIRANTKFLEGTGITLLPNKTIKVNEFMQTDDENIYALGDCASVSNRITKQTAWSPMGSSANIEGRLVAKHIAGTKIPYQGVLGTGVAKLAGFNVGKTGLSEAAAKAAGFDAVSVTAVVDDKAHYYPGADSFIVKMTADKVTQKLLGLQVMGKGAVDKMVDIAVTAISLGATLEEIENMDLAYAPPFSTAIHPFSHTVNILLNKLSGAFETFTPEQYLKGEAEGYQLIDVSLAPSIDGAPYVDLGSVEGVLPEFPKDQKLLLVCTKGKRAYMLQNRLKYYGYTNTKALEGGTLFNDVKVEE